MRRRNPRPLPYRSSRYAQLDQVARKFDFVLDLDERLRLFNDQTAVLDAHYGDDSIGRKGDGIAEHVKFGRCVTFVQEGIVFEIWSRASVINSVWTHCRADLNSGSSRALIDDCNCALVARREV
jgi:hypothetical protein